MKKRWLLFPFAALLICVFQFFRDPERHIPEEGVVSPADGKIISIGIVKPGDIPKISKKGEEIYLEELKGLITEEYNLIAIFMNPFDVHTNRSPVKGTVSSIVYVEGCHHMAYNLALENERNILIIDGDVRIVVIQIAGKFARRIKCFVKEGDSLKKGERIGKIVFGSQVVIMLPVTYKILVEEGEKVKAGESIIALP